MRGIRRLFLLAAILLYSLRSAGAAPNTEQGQHLFAQSCAGCHDAHSTQRLSAPGLKGYFHTQRPQPTDTAVRAVIQHGRGGMPAFPQLTALQLNALLAYLRTL